MRKLVTSLLLWCLGARFRPEAVSVPVILAGWAQSAPGWVLCFSVWWSSLRISVEGNAVGARTRGCSGTAWGRWAASSCAVPGGVGPRLRWPWLDASRLGCSGLSRAAVRFGAALGCWVTFCSHLGKPKVETLEAWNGVCAHAVKDLDNN